MKILKRYDVTLPLTAPFHFPSEDFGAFGYDSIGHEKDGRPLIPREQVRGLLRHGLLALCEVGHPQATDLLAAFGDEGPNAAPTPRSSENTADANVTFPVGSKGVISVTDAVGDRGVSDRIPPSPRIKLGEESGAVEAGHLLQTEQKLAPGASMAFSCQVYLYQAPDEDFSDLIRLAFEFHTSIGAMKSVGFGRVASPKVSSSSLRPVFEKIGSIDPEVTERMLWTFNVDRPYLVDATRPTENVYEGRQNIPGAALKGLLAQHLFHLGWLNQGMSEALSALSIGFARPVGARGAFPISIVCDEETGRLIDLAATDVEIDDQCRLERTADWKEDDRRKVQIDALYDWMGQPKPFSETQGYENRIHVKIDSNTGTVVPHMLYTSIALEPPKAGFSTVLDFGQVPKAMRRELLDGIRQHQAGLGRTDAVVVTESLQSETLPEEDERRPGRVVIMLETPALMIAPSAGDFPREVYGEFWKSKLPNSSMLSHFTHEQLVGGYQAMRFGRSGEYRPFILTEPGSVFVLDLHTEDIALFRELLRFGICIDNWAGLTPSWRNCPFVPENGYGRLSLYRPFNDGGHP